MGQRLADIAVYLICKLQAIVVKGAVLRRAHAGQ